jgi:predicted phosphoadenosine phosphosulfate sulfurtransferase
MRIHLNESVWEVALDRIRYLFQEFPNVVVGFSGGKWQRSKASCP